MAHHGMAVLEEALRVHKLDRTLTMARLPGHDEGGTSPTGLVGLDAMLCPTAHAPPGSGGLPRGELSEIAGSRSSGRTTLLLQVLAAATCRGEMAALVDPFDRLDVASVVSAGMDLDRLLWIRGHDSSIAGARHQQGLLDRTIERALKALNLVLQAGGFCVVALDLADAPPAALTRIPLTTWLRVQRTIEGSDTACVLVGSQPLARSAGGLTLALAGHVTWTGFGTRDSGLDTRDSALGIRDSPTPIPDSRLSNLESRTPNPEPRIPSPESWSRRQRLAGMDVTVRVVSPRRRIEGEITVGARVHECSGAEGRSQPNREAVNS